MSRSRSGIVYNELWLRRLVIGFFVALAAMAVTSLLDLIGAAALIGENNAALINVVLSLVAMGLFVASFIGLLAFATHKPPHPGPDNFRIYEKDHGEP